MNGRHQLTGEDSCSELPKPLLPANWGWILRALPKQPTRHGYRLRGDYRDSPRINGRSASVQGKARKLSLIQH